MISGLDSLRKNYVQMTSFERANMLLHEVTNNQREAVTKALVAPTLREAYIEAGLTCCLVMVSGYALVQSLKADRARHAGLGIALVHKGDNSPHAVFDSVVNSITMATNSAEAWITALAKLEEETGGAFMAAAKLLDDTHPAEMLVRSGLRVDGPVDDTEQLTQLHAVWRQIGDGNN